MIKLHFSCEFWGDYFDSFVASDILEQQLSLWLAGNS